MHTHVPELSPGPTRSQTQCQHTTELHVPNVASQSMHPFQPTPLHPPLPPSPFWQGTQKGHFLIAYSQIIGSGVHTTAPTRTGHLHFNETPTGTCTCVYSSSSVTSESAPKGHMERVKGPVLWNLLCEAK